MVQSTLLWALRAMGKKYYGLCFFLSLPWGEKMCHILIVAFLIGEHTKSGEVKKPMSLGSSAAISRENGS